MTCDECFLALFLFFGVWLTIALVIIGFYVHRERL